MGPLEKLLHSIRKKAWSGAPNAPDVRSVTDEDWAVEREARVQAHAERVAREDPEMRTPGANTQHLVRLFGQWLQLWHRRGEWFFRIEGAPLILGFRRHAVRHGPFASRGLAVKAAAREMGQKLGRIRS